MAHSFVYDEAYRLAEKGFKVHILRALIEPDSESYGMIYHGIRKKVEYRTLPFLMRSLADYGPAYFLRRSKNVYKQSLYAYNGSKVVTKSRINLIHAHFAYPEGFVGYLMKKRCQKPLVVSVHGYDIQVEPSIQRGTRLNKRLDTVVRKVLNYADRIVVPSRAIFDEVEAIAPREKVRLIPHGVDLEKFNPNLDSDMSRKELGIDQNTVVVFTLRHHEKVYGIEYLLRAVPDVLGRVKNVLFLIGGEGHLRNYHEKLTADLRVQDNVRFTGGISRSKVPLYYAASDIVVVPSLQEGFGIVVSEAMACGKPVIGTEVGGIPDQVTDGLNGFLIKPKNSDEIAEKILYMIEEPDEAKKMGISGRKLAEEKFDINKKIERLVALYEEVKGKPKSSI